jgi:hypothetical protein
LKIFLLLFIQIFSAFPLSHLILSTVYVVLEITVIFLSMFLFSVSV